MLAQGAGLITWFYSKYSIRWWFAKWSYRRTNNFVLIRPRLTRHDPWKSDFEFPIE